MARIIYSNMPAQPELKDQQTTLDCTPAVNPVLFQSETETYQLTFQVTAEQWVKLFSAATAGADLLYPDESIDVVFPLRQAVDCMPTFCEAVENCIETVEGIREIIREIGGGQGERGAEGELPPVCETNPVIFDDCDEDNLFGACSQLTDLFNSTIVDIFEIIEAASNQMELANEVLEAIPGLNLLASALDIINVLQEQLAENYDAAYTVALRNEIRCGLFCLAQETCELDWFSMFEWFGEKVGQLVFDIDLEDFIEYISMGVWSGDEIVYISFFWLTGMLSYGGSFLGITAETLLKIAGAALNDPDSDWETVCDECAWEYDVSFITDPGDWVSYADLIDPPSTYDATWQIGQGFVRSGSGTDPFGIALPVPPGTNITQVLISQYIQFSATGWVYADKDQTPPPTTEIKRVDSRANAGVETYIDDIDYTFTNNAMVLQITRQNNSTIRVTRIRLRGTGSNPFT